MSRVTALFLTLTAPGVLNNLPEVLAVVSSPSAFPLSHHSRIIRAAGKVPW